MPKDLAGFGMDGLVRLFASSCCAHRQICLDDSLNHVFMGG